MKIEFLLDENVQVMLAGALKARGVDAVSAQELGRKGLSDEEQLKFAGRDNRTFFTYNVKDFVELHRRYIIEGKEHLSKQLPIGEALKRLLSLISTLSAEDMVIIQRLHRIFKRQRNSWMCGRVNQNNKDEEFARSQILGCR